METINLNMENLTEDEREMLIKLIEKSNQPKAWMPKAWKPKLHEEYFATDDRGNVARKEWTQAGNIIDISRYSIGNCFKSREEAEFAVEKLKVITELKRFAEENNEHDINWDDRLAKFNLYYDHSDGKVKVTTCFECQYNSIYFSDPYIAHRAIDAVGVERIKKYLF